MTKDMTQGSPMKLILGFSIPLLFGFLFQQLYNVVDTIIVGKYLGVDSLAAVGSTGSINFFVLGFCMGVCNGFSIPISHKFGAGDYKGMRKYVANCLWLGIAFSVVVTLLTTFFCRDILIFMKTPENILEEAHRYIWIIFFGIPTAFLYNIVSGIIRALGDSKTPVVFLIISSFVNIGLNITFIVNLHMGVEGVAWATVIAQLVSGVGCLIYMIKKFEILHLEKDEWAPDVSYMKTLCGMGIPMGLQYSITAIGSVILQMAANTLGSWAVASMTAALRISCFLATPFDAMGSTMATYGGQNVGAGKLERLGKGLKACTILGAVYSVIALCISWFGGSALAALFVENSETLIIENARMFLVLNTLFYFPLALVNIIRFLIQGMGFPNLAMIAGVLEMAARAIAGFFMVPVMGFVGAGLGSPLAWVLADIFLIPAYFKTRQILQKRQEAGEKLHKA